MNTLKGINTRHIGILGLVALGAAVAAPVQAAPNFPEGAFIVARNDRSGEARQDQRDDRRDSRRASQQEAGRDTRSEEPQGYGYGYERRQQQRDEEENDRPRGRR